MVLVTPALDRILFRVWLLAAICTPGASFLSPRIKIGNHFQYGRLIPHSVLASIRENITSAYRSTDTCIVHLINATVKGGLDEAALQRHTTGLTAHELHRAER